MKKGSYIFVVVIVMVIAFFVNSVFMYVNGAGCDFSFKMNSAHVGYIGQCKSGVFTSSANNELTGAVSYSKYLYGIDDEHIYFLRLTKENSVALPLAGGPCAKEYRHVLSFMDDGWLYIARYKCLNHSECYLYFDTNIENTFKLKIDGRKAFLLNPQS